jgi:hypothetical protein
MIKKTLYIVMLLSLSVLYFGCSSVDWGVARLPDAKTLFISTAVEQSFVAKKSLVIPYQPVGFMGIRADKFQACGGNLTGTYTSLERAINQELIDKARNELGGDAVIDFKWDVSSSWQRYLEAYQMTSQHNIYIGAIMMIGMPFAYVLNSNTVRMYGTVVKKK